MAVSVSEIPLATLTGEMVTQGIEDISSSFVVSGLGGSDGGGTTLAIAEGTARIGGYRAITDAVVNQDLTDNSVNYVYFSLTTDAQARVNGAEFVDSPTTLAVDTRILIAEVTCASGAITTIIDQRAYLPITSLDIRDIPVQDADIITSGTLATARIPDLSADKIASGTLADARIPDLDADKITTGTLATARIPNLNASKITAGELADARIPDVDTLSYGTTFATAQIPNLDASKVASGELAVARIPSISEFTSHNVPLGNTSSTSFVTFATCTVSYGEDRTNQFFYSGSFYNSVADNGGEIALRILPDAGIKMSSRGWSAGNEDEFNLILMHGTVLSAATYTYVLTYKAAGGGTLYIEKSSDMLISSFKK